MTITVHYLNNSRAQRVLFMLEELELPYRIEVYYRDKKTRLAPENLKLVHPLGKAPVISDGDLTLAESGAILEYLARKYGNGRLSPPQSMDDPDFVQYIYWMHYAEGSLMPLLLTRMFLDQIQQRLPDALLPTAARMHAPLLDGYIKPSLTTHLTFVEQHLQRNEWFIGDKFSAADIQMSFPLETFVARSEDPTYYRRINSWVQRTHARPAYQRALAAGAPYAFAEQ